MEDEINKPVKDNSNGNSILVGGMVTVLMFVIVSFGCACSGLSGMSDGAGNLPEYFLAGSIILALLVAGVFVFAMRKSSSINVGRTFIVVLALVVALVVLCASAGFINEKLAEIQSQKSRDERRDYINNIITPEIFLDQARFVIPTNLNNVKDQVDFDIYLTVKLGQNGIESNDLLNYLRFDIQETGNQTSNSVSNKNILYSGNCKTFRETSAKILEISDNNEEVYEFMQNGEYVLMIPYRFSGTGCSNEDLSDLIGRTFKVQQRLNLDDKNVGSSSTTITNFLPLKSYQIDSIESL